MNTLAETLRFCATCSIGVSLLAWASGCDRAGGSGGAQADEHDHAEHDDSHDAHGHGEDEHAGEVRLTGEAIVRYGVKVEEAALWALRPTFTAPARVAFNTEAMAHVGSPLPGRAVEIRVRVGDVVAKGDPLLVIESPELGEAQADFFQKRVAAESAGPTAELSRLAWERAKGLLEESQGISLTEVQKREAEYKAAAAATRSAEAAAIGAENRLHILGMSQEQVSALAASGEIEPRFTIAASIDGQVIDREVTLGELVNPEREALMVLADTTTLWVLADVPDARLREVAVGARAWVRVGGVGGSTYEGQVALIPFQVDPATRTAQVRIEVPSSALPLKPGMFAQVEIVSTDPDEPEPSPVIAVPDVAVQTVEGATVVFVPVAGEENTFVERRVGVGKAVGGLVPIHAGLVEGERFVAAGSFILKAELGKSTAEHVH